MKTNSTSSTIPTLQICSPIERQSDNRSPRWSLKWRRGQLLVSLSKQSEQLSMSAFESKQQLVECLKHSPVRIVSIDSTLDAAGLKHWADACEQAHKLVFFRGAVAQKLFGKQTQLGGQLKRLIEQVVALFLLAVLSPVILVVVALISVHSPGAIFSGQWHVGARGKLFRMFKFRTAADDEDFASTLLGRTLSKYGLDKLPQLFNVLRGEMNLMGQRPLTLGEAVRFGAERQRWLNKLPKIAEGHPVWLGTN